MRPFKKLGVLAVVVFALSAIGAANASAAQFTYTGPFSFSGEAGSSQVFTFNSGQLKCNVAESQGTAPYFFSDELHLTVTYKQCTYLNSPAHVSQATYKFTANGEVHMGGITILSTFGGCHFTIPAQTRKSVSYSGSLKLTTNLTGIVYTSTGGLCGSSGISGTYSGENKINGVVSHDP
jgi:hypothetical protein